METHSIRKICNKIYGRLGREIRQTKEMADNVLTSVASDMARAHLSHLAVDKSRSQLGQDIFALTAAGGTSPGFFVEFGAGDGTELSNTYLLESECGWDGILAEPNPAYAEQIRASRTARIDSRCVWSESGLSVKLKQAGYLTSMETHVFTDHHAQARMNAPGGWFTAETVSLIDLLEQHDAPKRIAFLSIDTEGSEFDILSSFPWNGAYQFRAIAVEHNYAENRSRVSDLLLSHGYIQVGLEVSKHDDWFVLL